MSMRGLFVRILTVFGDFDLHDEDIQMKSRRRRKQTEILNEIKKNREHSIPLQKRSTQLKV